MAKNLPESLEIHDEQLVSCLGSIEVAVGNLWKPPQLQHYTEHGLDHSRRIIRIIGNLLEDHTDLLNEHERFILLASAYLHDIGMQSPPHAGLPLKFEGYTIEESEIIRAKHNESSATMILESVSTSSELSLGLEHCEDYANSIATLSKYHRKLDISEVDDTSLAGEDIRLPLLIALLRLGDELDADYRRVNMEILKLRDIPVQSKFHWWSHYYVSSIRIRNGRIDLYFRFPEKYREDTRVEAFRNKICESVRDQFLEVYDIFYRHGIRLYRDIRIKEEKYIPDGVLEPIPGDLSEYINENVLKITESSKKLSAETGAAWFVDGVAYSDDAEVVNCLNNVINLVAEGRNLDAAGVVKRCRTLMMAPKERMIFSSIAGNCCYIIGELIEAKKYYEDALNIAKRRDLQEIYKETTVSTRAATLGNIGLIYSARGDLDNALKYQEDALVIHREIGYRQGEASDLGNIGLIYMTKGDLDNSLKYLKEALKINKEIGYRQGEANQLGNIGLIYMTKGDLDNSLKYLKEALKINKEIGYRQGEANQLGNIGLIYRAKGDLDNSLKYHQEALKIHRGVGHRQGEANQLGNIGLIYRAKGDLDNSLKYLKEALKINKAIGYKQSEASVLGNIGLIYSDKGDLKNALKYHREALKINKAIGYKQSEASVWGNIGLIYMSKGDLENALKYHQEALKIHREVGYKQGEAIQLGNIGLVYRAKGDLNNAIKYHRKALEIFDIAAPQLIVQTLNNLATIYFKKQSYEKGFEYLARAISSSSSIEQLNTVLFPLLRTVREMIIHDRWENLGKIHSTYTSGIVTDEIWLNFFKAIHEYAIYKKIGDESHMKNHKSARQKLNPALNKLLDELLEAGR